MKLKKKGKASIFLNILRNLHKVNRDKWSILTLNQINGVGKIKKNNNKKWKDTKKGHTRCMSCQRTISTQQFKLLGEVSGYDLYYSLTHPFKWKPFGLETCIDLHYLVLIFFIKYMGVVRFKLKTTWSLITLIPCQRTISTQ